MNMFHSFGLPRRETTASPLDVAGARILTLETRPPLTYAVGDVHGCLDLYLNLEARIQRDAAEYAPDSPALLVVLGDVIDRGPDSALLLDHLIAPAPHGIERVVLAGNHEDMFTRFLDDPEGNRAWLNFGGRETLMSYGLTPTPPFGFDLPAIRLRQLIEATVPQDHRAFLSGLPCGLAMPGWFLSHAGRNPDAPLAKQARQDLIWGDPARLDARQDHDAICVHGHVPCALPETHGARINLDTGAYATGRLSALRITEDGTHSFLSQTHSVLPHAAGRSEIMHVRAK